MNTGGDWNQQARFRSTTINESAAVPPMYILIKDHKKPGPNGVPRTRPVVSGNSGMNVHLNNTLSEIVEPIARLAADSAEVISTEDSSRIIDDTNMKLKEGMDGETADDSFSDTEIEYYKCSSISPNQSENRRRVKAGRRLTLRDWLIKGPSQAGNRNQSQGVNPPMIQVNPTGKRAGNLNPVNSHLKLNLPRQPSVTNTDRKCDHVVTTKCDQCDSIPQLHLQGAQAVRDQPPQLSSGQADTSEEEGGRGEGCPRVQPGAQQPVEGCPREQPVAQQPGEGPGPPLRPKAHLIGRDREDKSSTMRSQEQRAGQVMWSVYR